MAFATPVLVMVMLGCIDFGRFPSTAIAVRNAARVGAEFARSNHFSPATEDRWRALVRQAVQDEMSGLVGFDAELLTEERVSASRIDLEGGRTQVRVTVSYPFQTIIRWDYPGFGIPSRFDVRHQFVMEGPGR